MTYKERGREREKVDREEEEEDGGQVHRVGRRVEGNCGFGNIDLNHSNSLSLSLSLSSLLYLP